jgi:predicted nucleic acid-binding protein
VGMIPMKIFLDACIIIYWVESAPPFYSMLLTKFESLARQYPQHQLSISRLSLLECLVKPLREKDKTTLNIYRQFFEAPDLSIIEIDEKIIDIATMLRANNNIRTPDAIQIASCLSLEGPHLFLTNDRGVNQVAELNVIQL